MQNTVLVTGGSGFIGTWVLRETAAKIAAMRCEVNRCRMLQSSGTPFPDRPGTNRRPGWADLQTTSHFSHGVLHAQACHLRGEGAHWFSTMKAALNMIGPSVGDPQPPIQPLPQSHRTTLANMLVSLGYEVRQETRG